MVHDLKVFKAVVVLDLVSVVNVDITGQLEPNRSFDDESVLEIPSAVKRPRVRRLVDQDVTVAIKTSAATVMLSV